ncbi:hypothetical protein ARB_07364 [Paecilomyces variotii No. 5]|uniref:N-acetyltransferase domain-containing protein n=1 Tax=Byssochlamys spectabilis (strain No. 5 / NBRC 109023) TaxID=1356009 RepID=V5GCQ2_BYSSN|nr:hypothetical protein ARB_07364 [Paecilomyces variotii No. 5]
MVQSSLPLSVANTTTTTRSKPPTRPIPFPLRIQTITPSPLLAQQPWLADLTRMINDSFAKPATTDIKFSADRLHTNTQLIEELGEKASTVVAFDESSSLSTGGLTEGETPTNYIVGTASIKDWVDDGLWLPVPPQALSSSSSLPLGDTGAPFICPGDLEISIVAVRPGVEYRKRGIAEKLVRECEQEAIRRMKQDVQSHQNQEQRDGGPLRIRLMVKVVKEMNGPYWLNRGFEIIGQRFCPTGMWGANIDFTLWAMVKVLIVQNLKNDD